MPFPRSLTTTPFGCNSIGQFEASSCKRTSGGLLPSSIQHRSLTSAFVPPNRGFSLESGAIHTSSCMVCTNGLVSVSVGSGLCNDSKTRPVIDKAIRCASAVNSATVRCVETSPIAIKSSVIWARRFLRATRQRTTTGHSDAPISPSFNKMAQKSRWCWTSACHSMRERNAQNLAPDQPLARRISPAAIPRRS